MATRNEFIRWRRSRKSNSSHTQVDYYNHTVTKRSNRDVKSKEELTSSTTEERHIIEIVGSICSAKHSDTGGDLQELLQSLLVLSEQTSNTSFLKVIDFGFITHDAIEIIQMRSSLGNSDVDVVCMYLIIINLAQMDPTGQAITTMVRVGVIRAILDWMNRLLAT